MTTKSEPMEQISPTLRKVGHFYEVDGEPIRRVVGRARIEKSPLQTLWELREDAQALSSHALPDDTYDDEPLRRVVGKARPR